MPYYVVRAGDHLDAIAHRHALSRDAIWSHENNADLRRRRERGEVLAPGDVLFLPASERREPSTLRVGSVNSFRAEVPKVDLRLRLVDGAEPMRGVACELHVGGRPIEATSDGEGNVHFSIRVTARRARLRVPSHGVDQWLAIGDLDPVDTVRGLQARLRELGHYLGPVDGQEGEELAEAVAEFQRARGLTADGVASEVTRRALVEAFGV